jgi:hypothetical protein
MHKRKSLQAIVASTLLVSVAGAVLATPGTPDHPQATTDSLLQVATLSGRVTALVRLGNTLLAGVGGHVYTIDLSTHQLLGQKVVDGTPIESLHTYRGRGLADTQYSIYSLDATEPGRPQTQYLTSEARLRGSVIVGDYALRPSVRLNIVYLNALNGPELRGEYRGITNPTSIDAVGRTAYVGTNRGELVVLDVTNPEQPQPLGHITMTLGVKAVDAEGSMVYLFGGETTYRDSGDVLTVCDVRDPAAPRVVSQLELPRPDRIAQSLWADYQIMFINGYVYMFTPKAGLAIVDVRLPATPRLVQLYDLHTLTDKVLRVGDRLYIARSDADLEVLDIRDPEHPTSIERIRFPNRGETSGLAVAGKRLYVAAEEEAIVWLRPFPSGGVVQSPDVPELELRVVDVSDPLSPSVLGAVTTGVGEYVAAYGRRDTIKVMGRHVVLLVKNDLVTVDAGDPTRPTVVGRLNLPGSPTRLELLGSLGLVGDGSDQLLLLDLTRPDDPRILGSARLPAAAADWGVVGELVYLISPPERLSDVPYQPRRSTLFLLRIDACGKVSTVGQLLFVHIVGSITLSSAALDPYIYFGSSSLHIFDASDPTAPQEAFRQQGVFGLFGGGVISARDDRLILRITSDNGCMVAIFDISDRVQPTYIGSQYTSYATCSQDAVAAGAHVYIANSYDGLTVNLPLLPGMPTPTPRSDPGQWPPPTAGPTRPGMRPTRTATATSTHPATATASRPLDPTAVPSTPVPLPHCEPTQTPSPTAMPSPAGPPSPLAIFVPLAASGE